MTVTRRTFLRTATIAAAALATARLTAAQSSPRLVLATWPNYHDPENLRRFTTQTGIVVEPRIFGSNEEMMAHLLKGQSGFDVVVATNYAVNAYGKMGLLRPLKLSRFPQFDRASQQERFVSAVMSRERLYGLPKNWGTTGFVYHRQRLAASPTRWREFWDLARSLASGRCVIHDYQLTTIGNALKYFGYSFNSVTDAELGQVEQLLMQVKPHLRTISSLAYEQMKAGAALSMAWSGDGELLRREDPDYQYVIAQEGGEIWADYFTIPRDCRNVAAAEQLIDFLIEPKTNAREVLAHGFPPIDNRVLPLLPPDMLRNPTMFPPESALTALEFGARETLTHPRRADILAKLKAG